MAPNGKHKSLAGSFGVPAPERGSKLQGLLNTPGRGAAPAHTPHVPAPPVPNPTPPIAEPAIPITQPAEELEPAAPQVEAAPAEGAGAVATRVAPVRRKRATGSGGVSASSVYLTADAYKQLTTTKSRKIKDYAQIVQDAFARIADEAAEQKKSPDDVLASLFEVPKNDDPWLMPSSTTRPKSPKPLTEARISFSAQQREWIEGKMTVVKAGTFSEFIARVLEHHLLPPAKAKAKRGK
jgi:hypothetical protein